jgi:ATP-dependent helicase HrpA
VDDGGRVDLRLLPPGASSVEQHRRGVRRLLLKSLPQQTALIRDRLFAARDVVLGFHGLGDNAALLDDVLTASADQSFSLEPPPRTAEEFAAVLGAGRATLVATADELLALLREILPLHRALRGALAAGTGRNPAAAAVHADLTAQLERLLPPSFLTATPPEWRRHLPRYLRAAQQRWDRRGQRRDAELAAEVRAAEARLERWSAALPPGWPWPPAIVDYRWLLEELRVSLFAQTLGTARPVSVKRLERLWAAAQSPDAVAAG